MEHYDLGYGTILYRTTVPAGPAATVEASDVHDFGHVFLNGQGLGVMDRRSHIFTVRLPERGQAGTLDIIVETAGRVNFGPEVLDRKGLYGPVHISSRNGKKEELAGPWQIFCVPLADGPSPALKFKEGVPTGPAFYELTVNIQQPADTFLDMHNWGKGIVWVNGHCLGRFWNIGPTQTMYLPGPWLQAGANRIVVLDFLGPQTPSLAGLEHPILNELHPEKDFSHRSRPNTQLLLSAVKPAFSGTFSRGAALQEVKLPTPATGRYFCIQSVDAYDGKPFAAIGELELIDAASKPLSQESWTIAYVDSEERTGEDGSAENAIDGQTTSYWHSQRSGGGTAASQPQHPHSLVIDLGRSETVSGFRYTPRQGPDGTTGRIKDYRIYVGDGLIGK
jgi:beta-galactosidase